MGNFATRKNRGDSGAKQQKENGLQIDFCGPIGEFD